MPYKIPQSKVKQRMAKEAQRMAKHLTQLQREHNRMVYQHSILSQCCDLMQWLRMQQLGNLADFEGNTPLDELLLLQELDSFPCSVASIGSAASTAAVPAAEPMEAAAVPTDTAARLQAVVKQEPCAAVEKQEPYAADMEAVAVLVKQEPYPAEGSPGALLRSSCSSSNSSATYTAHTSGSSMPGGLPPMISAVATSVLATICPEHDIMHLFCRLLSQPAFTAADNVTLRQLQDDYATTICELSLHLAMLESPPHLQASCGSEHPASAIERLVLRHLHQLVTLMLQQRSDLIMAFYLSNCLSGDVGEELQKEAIARAVQQLQLSPVQQQQISDGFAVFRRLLAPLIQARQQLQCVGFTSAAAETHSSSWEGRAGGATGALGGGLLRRTSSLQQQQHKVSNLSMLMKKEMFLKACCSTTTLSSLTWLQVARMIVHTFPYPAPMAAIAQEVTRQWEEHQSVGACSISSNGQHKPAKM